MLIEVVDRAGTGRTYLRNDRGSPYGYTQRKNRDSSSIESRMRRVWGFRRPASLDSIALKVYGNGPTMVINVKQNSIKMSSTFPDALPKSAFPYPAEPPYLQPKLTLPIRPHRKQIDNRIQHNTPRHHRRNGYVVPPKREHQVQRRDLERNQHRLVQLVSSATSIPNQTHDIR